MAVFLWLCFLMVSLAVAIQTSQSAPQYCSNMPRTCHDVYSNGKDKYKIATMEDGTTHLCETFTDNGGWTVIQRRFNGDVDFYRNFLEYTYGFGDMNGDFWWGLKKIAEITSKGLYELYVSFDFDGRSYYARYKKFMLYERADNFRLNLGNYSGTAGDSLKYHNTMSFSTFDRDNDRKDDTNCAYHYHGAWWYNECHHSNLNGLWESTNWAEGTVWRTTTGFYKSAYNIEMKIRLTRPRSD